MKMSETDHRTRVTKMLIRRAFTDLLRTQPIQSISVKRLCEKAGINRGTFYAHYTDVYDLLRTIEEDLFAACQRSLRPLLERGEQELNPVEINTEVFQCLKDNADICAVILGPYGDKDFLARIIRMGRDLCVNAYTRYFKEATPQQIEYFYAFASSGCMGLIQKWMEEGMLTPAGDIARMAENIMLHGAGSLGKLS